MTMKLSLPEKINTPRLTLARLRYEDAPEIFYAYASKPEATRFVSWPTHRRIEDTYAFLRYARTAWAAGQDYSFGIRLNSNNMLVGSIGALHAAGQVQFGYILSPAHWGMGYATEACRAVLDKLAKEPHIIKTGTFVAAENHASIRVLEKCGLVREAHMPGWFLFPNAGTQRRDCIQFMYPGVASPAFK